LSVQTVKHAASVLKTVDPGFGTRVSDELRCHGIYVETNVRVERIDREDTRLHVIGSNQFQTTADLLLVGVGVQPNSELARVAGIEVGERGAIYVSRRMETNLPDIYAAGDCVETWHRVLNLATYLPLGSTAHKQGFVAGENAVGGAREFAGIVGTRVVKVFDLVIARTGLRDQEAAQAGFDPFTVESSTWDHKAYYPEAHEVRIRVTGDRKTGRVLRSADAWVCALGDCKADRHLRHRPVPQHARREVERSRSQLYPATQQSLGSCSNERSDLGEGAAVIYSPVLFSPLLHLSVQR
jgi:NADPH-dependent 2,4-dienoyl-CoA reductase/sulfur reductase-like enzyme